MQPAGAVAPACGLLDAAARNTLDGDHDATVIKESVFLTAETSAMVCWLFVGSSIFSRAFALPGGQELSGNRVMSLGLSTIQCLLLSQAIVFLLGWRCCMRSRGSACGCPRCCTVEPAGATVTRGDR